MAQPRVSIVVPTYNRAKTLARAVNSALGQSFQDFELIVVDDGSTDETPQLLAGFTDRRLRSVRRQQGGVAAARNAGVAEAHGDLIAFLDSDDEWLPWKLERQLDALNRAGLDAGLVVCNLLRWTGARIVQITNREELDKAGGDLRRALRMRNFALTSGWLVRRDHFYMNGPFDEALPPLEDWEWLIRYCARQEPILVEEPLAIVYESSDSISGNQRNYIRALEGIVLKHQAGLAADPSALSNLHYVLGRKYCLYDQARIGRRHFAQALRLRPGNWRIWAAIMLSFASRKVLFLMWRTVRPKNNSAQSS
jgi:glycosyltransferase involved in cell wall biosynthesis